MYAQKPIDKFIRCLEIISNDTSLLDKQLITIGVENDSVELVNKSTMKAIQRKFRLMFKNEIFFNGVEDAYFIKKFSTNSDSAELILKRQIYNESNKGNYFNEIIIKANFISNNAKVEENIVLEED